MKKCFIGMSIKNQLFFGICGISALFSALCILLILLASSKLYFSYNLAMKGLFNDIDTKIVSLNGENGDLFGQLLFNQGKFESVLIRNYLSSISYEFGKEIVDIFDIDSSEINRHIKFYFDSTNLCNEIGSKCFFIFSEQNQINDSTKKLLYYLLPLIDISLDMYAYNKDNFKIFNKFHFYEKENRAYISYKYDKKDIDKNFANFFTPTVLMNNSVISLVNEIPLIENLNKIKVNEITNEKFFKENIFTLFHEVNLGKFIDPFYKSFQQIFHFGSFLFDQKKFNDNDNVSISNIIYNNLENYLSFDMNLDSLSFFSLNFIQRNGAVLIFLVGNDFRFTASESVCQLGNFYNFTYSDNSINNNLSFSINNLGLDKIQLNDISDCFSNEKMIDLIKSDNKYIYKLQILADIYKYNYTKDFNNNIKIKILRKLLPNQFMRYSFLKLRFYSSYSIYLVVVKIYNNILVIHQIIDRLTFRAICLCTFFTFLLWFLIYVWVIIKLCLVTDRISSPIRKLIHNISLSQGSFNNDESNLEKIYYKEDKDINDLFQLCQRLIIGGFRKKKAIKKKDKLNVYNNVSKIKTNNMIINENDIASQRNEKYNEIFERRSELIKKEDNFKTDIYYKFKNEDFELKIKNYEIKKTKRISFEQKEELEMIKNKDYEYKMFYYINNEIEGFLPFNSLYKCYYDEFSKKNNKKKKK